VQVAERLGVSQAAYSRLEKGKVRLTLERLMALAEVYGMEVGVLMQGV
jgi:transcriptional regulator with XRE-family HTH domain